MGSWIYWKYWHWYYAFHFFMSSRSLQNVGCTLLWIWDAKIQFLGIYTIKMIISKNSRAFPTFGIFFVHVFELQIIFGIVKKILRRRCLFCESIYFALRSSFLHIEWQKSLRLLAINYFHQLRISDRMKTCKIFAVLVFIFWSCMFFLLRRVIMNTRRVR